MTTKASNRPDGPLCRSIILWSEVKRSQNDLILVHDLIMPWSRRRTGRRWWPSTPRGTGWGRGRRQSSSSSKSPSTRAGCGARSSTSGQSQIDVNVIMASSYYGFQWMSPQMIGTFYTLGRPLSREVLLRIFDMFYLPLCLYFSYCAAQLI